MKILIVPDLHLGAGTSIGKDYNIGLNSRIQDQKDLLDFVYQTAKDNNINKIVVLGDIWDDAKPEPTVVYVFFDWLVKCSNQFNIEIIQGNHDFARSGINKISMLDCLKIPYIENCSIHTEIGIGTDSIVEEQAGIICVPFTDRKQLGAKTIDEAKEMLFNNIKNTITRSFDDWFKNKYKKICFGHFALEGSMWVGNEIADDHNEIFITKDMMKELGFDYVFMGHVHKPQIISNSEPYMAHVGSLDRTKFTGPDATEKFITIFDTINNEIENIKLPCRNLIDIPIIISKTDDEADFVIDYINKISKQDLKNSIIRIKIESNSPEYKYVNRDKIKNFLKKAGVFNISSITEIKHNEQVLKNDVGIDETINHDEAIDIFVDNIKGSYLFKSEVKRVCKEIVKETSIK